MKSLQFLVVSGCLLMLASGSSAASLVLNTEEYPPFNFVDPGRSNNVVGIVTDVVREMVQRAQIDHTVQLGPWKRAYDNALNSPGNCVFSTTMTEERMPLFKWVGPIVNNDWVMFVRADSAMVLNSLEDAKGHLIGGYLGDATAQFLESQGFMLELAANDRLNARKLDAGRIQIWASGNKLGPYIAKSEGVAIKPLLTFRETLMGLACHKSVPDATIQALQTALEQIKADGTFARIEASYR